MKLIFLILLIALDVSLGSDKKIMLVGFGNYQNQNLTLPDNENKTNISFTLIFKNENTSQNYDKLNFKISVSYDDKIEDFPVNCTNISNAISRETIEIEYNCFNVSGIKPDNIKKVSVKKSFNFSKSYDNDSIIYEEDEIVESSLASKAINNIINETKKLNIFTFFLSKIKSSNNKNARTRIKHIPLSWTQQHKLGPRPFLERKQNKKHLVLFYFILKTCPILMVLLVKLFNSFNVDTSTLFFLAILHRVSPFSTI